MSNENSEDPDSQKEICLSEFDEELTCVDGFSSFLDSNFCKMYVYMVNSSSASNVHIYLYIVCIQN